MEDLGLYIPESEYEKAIKKYNVEKQKMSKDFQKSLNRLSVIDNTITGLTAGMVAGTMFGCILAQTTARTPVRDANGTIKEYKLEEHGLTKSMLKAIATSVLIMLMVSGLRTNLDKKHNVKYADKLTEDTFDNILKKSLSNYSHQKQTTSANVRAAAVMIIANMPERDLAALRFITKAGLTEGKPAHQYIVRDECMERAIQIVSDFIRYNHELGNNITRIMRNEEPKTYFLQNAQKTH